MQTKLQQKVKKPKVVKIPRVTDLSKVTWGIECENYVSSWRIE